MAYKNKSSDNGKKLTVSLKIGNIIYPKCFQVQGVVMSGNSPHPNQIKDDFVQQDIEASHQSAQDIIETLDILSKSAEKMRSDLKKILRQGKIN